MIVTVQRFVGRTSALVLAVLLCGKPFQALLSVPLSLLGWAPGVVHALFVVTNHYEDQRSQRLLRVLERREGVV